MASDPSNPQVYYSGGTAPYDSINVMTVSKTINSGTNWTRSYLTTTTGFTYSLCVDPTNSNIVYAGGNPGLYKSTNGGTSWAGSGTGVSGYVYAIAVNPATPSIVYAGTPSGLFKSTNGGTSWASTLSANVKSIVIDPTAPNTVYAGTAAGVYKTTNGGTNWTVMNDGLLSTNVTCLGLNPGTYLFASTAGAGVHRWLFTGIEENTGSTPRSGFVIRPNPTAGKSLISYALPHAGKVRLVLYDNQGRLVQTLVTTVQDAGIHRIACHTDQLAAGVYFIELVTPQSQAREKLVVVR